MSAWDWVRAIATLGPITILLIAGVMIAVQSGLRRSGSQTVSPIVGSFSRTALQIGGYLVGLLAIHVLTGQQIPLMW